MTPRILLAGLCGLALAGGRAFAADDGPYPPSHAALYAPLFAPLYVKNLSPVAGLLGLPSQADARAPGEGRWEWGLYAGLASHYVRDGRDGSGAEQLLFDGETRRLALAGRYGFAQGWELQFELPWVWQERGSLDGAIDGWHDFWGMPDNGRGEAPRDRIAYQYADPAPRFDLRDSASGAGDASVALQRELYRGGGVTLAGTLGYKFGTGDAGDFTGSGEGDAYLALRVTGAAASAGEGALGWYGQVGYLRAGEVAELGPRQERDLWFAGAGLAWRVAQNWSLLAQVDAHSAPLDSALDALGSEAVMLSAGARWRFARQWSVEFSLVEDIAVETAPDVVFQFGLRYSGGPQ